MTALSSTNLLTGQDDIVTKLALGSGLKGTNDQTVKESNFGRRRKTPARWQPEIDGCVGSRGRL
jgi:hypothetical protein